MTMHIHSNIIIDSIQNKYPFLIGLGLWCSTPLSTIFQLYQSVISVEETRVPEENH